jgi:hypothetical protein
MGKKVVFAKSLALTGVFCGLAIALGVPLLTFMAVAGDVMSQGGAIAITIISVLAGAPIVLVSAFFGIVIPSTVEKSENPMPQAQGPRQARVRSDRMRKKKPCLLMGTALWV